MLHHCSAHPSELHPPIAEAEKWRWQHLQGHHGEIVDHGMTLWLYDVTRLKNPLPELQSSGQDHAKSCCCFWPVQGCPAQHPWTSSKQRLEESQQVRHPFFCRWPLLVCIKSTKKGSILNLAARQFPFFTGYSDCQIEVKLSQVHVKPPWASLLLGATPLNQSIGPQPKKPNEIIRLCVPSVGFKNWLRRSYKFGHGPRVNRDPQNGKDSTKLFKNRKQVCVVGCHLRPAVIKNLIHQSWLMWSIETLYNCNMCGLWPARPNISLLF